jgi:hypothetical protein
VPVSANAAPHNNRAYNNGGYHNGGYNNGGYRYYNGHYHDNTGAVVAAGIAGLAVGAALSNGGGYYDNYGSDRVYYSYGPPPGYYAGPAYYTYYGRCHASWKWNYRWHRYVRARGCW